MTAIIASSSIPFIFPPQIINGKYYVDGECKCYYDKFNEFIDENCIIIKLPDSDFCASNMESITGYVREMIYTITNSVKLKTTELTLNVNLPDKYNNKIDFDLTNKDKTELYLSGINQGQEFFCSKFNIV